MSGGFTPRHVLMFRDSGRIVPRVTIAEGNYIAGCLRLPRPISVPALTLTLNPLNADPEYTRGQKMSPCRGPRVDSGAECVFSYFCL